MSIYQKIAAVGTKFIKRHTLFKYGFNLSPMYRRSTGRITSVSEDLLEVQVRLAISYKNKNYVNSIFGGSMFSAVDPIPMVQLINILGDEYVVWDRSAEISFKRPAKEDLYAKFRYSQDEIEELKQQISEKNELRFTKLTVLTNADESITYCEVNKEIYVADKSYFKQKRAMKTLTVD